VHAEHELVPEVSALYAPAAQAVQAAAPFATKLNVPTPHAVQLVAPTAILLYRPPAHAVHKKEADTASWVL